MTTKSHNYTHILSPQMFKELLTHELSKIRSLLPINNSLM